MAVHTHFAVAIEVVQQDVIAGKLVLVGSNLFAIHRDARIAVANPLAGCVSHVAHHLVVGSVLLDDVEDVFDWAISANLVGNDAVARNRGLAK